MYKIFDYVWLSYIMFFLFLNFHNLGKKRADECNKGFFFFLNQISPYLEGKILESPHI
jgi:hypothetical protein